MNIMATSALALTVCASLISARHRTPLVTLEPVGTYRTGIFDEGASEIVAFDYFTKRLFSVNAHTRTVDVLSLRNPADPRLLFSIDLTPYGKSANSVAVKYGLLAVAVENEDKQAPGSVLLFRTWGRCPLVNTIEAGALPDMVTFTPDGSFILVANEGEPDDDYKNDPEGSVSIVDLRHGPYRATVATASFGKFNDRKEELAAAGVRVFGPNATVAQDIEPEYIAVAHDSRTAWVTLQENNALALVNIRKATVEKIVPLGYKDHRDPANKLDVSNKDGMIYLNTWPLFGMYCPDAITSFTVCGKEYLITANEGDSRDYDGYSEEERVKDLTLDPVAFPFADDLQKNENLGRIKVTTSMGDIDHDGDFDRLYSFGGRSFSILRKDGSLLYESGSLLEEITAEYYPDDFNATNDENESFDNRSDDKGPEPEGITIGKVSGNTYAFIGLERIGGIVIFDVSNPAAPEFVDYVNTRDFSGDPATDGAGDLAPEGLIFVPARLSPNFKPLVIASYEVSGSITVFEVQPQPPKCRWKRYGRYGRRHGGCSLRYR